MSKMENTFAWGGGTKNVAALEQKVQRLEQQIQTINAQLPNFARFDQDNNWAPQTFSQPNESISFIQDNNANFLSWKKTTNDRRGYVGMGRRNQDVIDVWGKNGARVITLNNDLELAPAGNINCSNKKITNIADPTSETDAVNWRYVNSRIQTIEGEWRDFADLKTFNWPNIPSGVSKILDLKISYGARKENSLAAVTNVINLIDANTISFSGQSVSGANTQGAKLFATLTYITSR